MVIRFLKGFYRGLDAARRFAANLIFLAIVLAVAGGIWFSLRSPGLPSETILEIDLNGSLVMTPSTLSTGRSMLSKVMGQSIEETAIGDVVEALQAASEDDRVQAVLLRLDRLASAGPASVQEVGEAVSAFRKSGRKVYAWSDTYSQARWAIAAHADEIYMHPMGEVKLKGLESSALYWGGLIRRLGVTVSVAKAGSYKSAPEAYTRTGPSPEAIEAQKDWMNDEWTRFAALMESARGMAPGAVHEWIGKYLEALRAHGGDAAAAAVDGGLVKELIGWSDLKSRLAGRSCVKDGCAGEFTGLAQYLSTEEGFGVPGEPKVGVITVEGEITEDPVGTGKAAASELVPLIQSAQADDSVKALVVQINSPGGSAVASEKIREALLAFRATGRPVVAYFGDMAASGGYWISTAAQQVVSNPFSITGSIGVFGIIPSFENVAQKAGVGVYSMKTEEKGISASALAKPSEAALESARLQVADTYAKFLDRVAKARGMTAGQVDAIGQGRVWTGSQAKERGLADALGTFSDAGLLAADLARLEGDVQLQYLQPQRSGTVSDFVFSNVLSSSAAPAWLKDAVSLWQSVPQAAGLEQDGRTASVQARSLWELRL